MGANPLLHSDEIDTSVQMGHNIRRCDPLSFLTAAEVQAATSVADLITTIQGKTDLHADVEGWRTQAERALTISAALGDLTDADVVAATSVEDLVDQTAAEDDGLFQVMTLE